MSGGTPLPPSYRYSYTIGQPPPQPARVRTSATEVVHLAIAFVVLTFAFVEILSGGGLPPCASPLFIGIGATASLTGFLGHEMAHKVSAQRRGYWAEFRLSPFGLVFALITSVYGFLFAAPGATMIGGMWNRVDWGRTSLAGPVSNLVWGGLFFISAYTLGRIPTYTFVFAPLLFLAAMNGVFGAFNMVPLGPLDGRKVFAWNRATWAIFFVLSLAFAVGMYLLFIPLVVRHVLAC
jgi:Zn-dependent protease